MPTTYESVHLQAVACLAHRWCAGRLVRGVPAFAYAMAVAATVQRHAPAAGEPVVAAAILHPCIPLAPSGRDVLAQVQSVSPDAVQVLSVLHPECAGGGLATSNGLVTCDPDALLVSAAAWVPALQLVLRRGAASTDPAAFWVQEPLLDDLDKIAGLLAVAVRDLPGDLAHDLAQLLCDVRAAAARALN